MSEFLIEKDWQDFRNAGMLWWANRVLHIFGWVIVASFDSETGEFIKMYPARTKFRGFSSDIEEKNFERVTRWMTDNGQELLAEVMEE